MANEDFIGLLAQLIVYIFVLFGLKVLLALKKNTFSLIIKLIDAPPKMQI